MEQQEDPPDRGVNKQQEGPLEELQEDTAGEERSGWHVRPPERTWRQRGTKARESSLGPEGRASRRPHGGEAGRTPPDRGADEPLGEYIEELRKGSRKELQEELSEEMQEGSSNEKAGRRRGAKAMERSPGHLAGPGGGGVPRLWGTCRDPGEGVGTEKHKGRQKLAEGPTKELQENHPRSEEPASCRKDPTKGCREVQPVKVDAERKLQSPGHQGPLVELQDNPGDFSVYMKGQRGGGKPWPWRTRQTTREDPGGRSATRAERAARRLCR